jgi:hypothetical protein
MLTKSEIIFKRKELKPELRSEFAVKEIGLFVFFLEIHKMKKVILIC